MESEWRIEFQLELQLAAAHQVAPSAVLAQKCQRARAARVGAVSSGRFLVPPARIWAEVWRNGATSSGPLLGPKGARNLGQ